MRLFIAIQFEEKIIDAITDFQDDMKAQGVTGNYTPRENLHLTLAFIGEYGNPDDILYAMEQVELSPVEIRLEGVGRFGDLFWVGLSENPELVGYVKRLRRKLSEYGIPYDKKRFTPHITVIRKAEYRNGRIPVMEAPGGCMTVTRVSLMRSDRGRYGMIYTEVGAVEA